MGWQDSPEVEEKPKWSSSPSVEDEKAMPEYAPPEGTIGRIGRLSREYAKEQALKPSVPFGEAGLALGEAGLSMATGTLASALGGIRGLVSPLTGEDAAEAVRGTQQALTYEPRTTSGKLATEVAGAPLALASELGGKVGGAIGGLVGEKSRVAGEEIGKALPQMAATVLPAKSALRAARTPKTELPPATPAEAITRKSQQIGYVVPPSEAVPTVGKKLATGLGGKIQFEKQASLKNQQTTNKIIKQDLGLPPEQPLTPLVLEDVRQQAYKDYDNLAKAEYGTVTGTKPAAFTTEWETIGTPTVRPAGVRPNEKFVKTLDKLATDFSELKTEYPTLVKGTTFDKAVGELKREHNPEIALKLIQDLRNQSSHNFKGLDVPYSRKRLALFQRKSADALEQLFEDNLKETGNEKLVQSFRDARQKIAKSYAVEDALNETTGNIDAAVLAKQLKKGKPLTGGLKDVAEFARTHGKLVQMPEKMGATPGFSPLDIGAGVLEAGGAMIAGHPGYALAAGAIPLVRPALRSAALSDFYQRRGGSATRYDLAARRKKTAKAMAAPAAAGSESAQEQERTRPLEETFE